MVATPIFDFFDRARTFNWQTLFGDNDESE